MPANDGLAALRRALPAEYEVQDYLDRGGQGAVFVGRLRGEPVALKLFAPDCDPGFRRLDREIPLLETIDCPHLVKIRAHSEVKVDGVSTRLVAYEYLPGGDLRQFLIEGASLLSYQELARAGAHVALAIDELWSRRIVHRDIKPANVVLRDSQTYVLVDLGFARHMDRSNLTARGLAPGTAGYKSPEQALGRRNLTLNSDIFSLGVTLYQLASKVHPFNGAQHLIGSDTFTATPLSTHRDDLPEPFVRLIHDMMATRAAERPRNLFERFSALGMKRSDDSRST